MSDLTDKSTAWDAMVQARSSERETILAMLVNATKQRDCFHAGGVTMKNSAGNDLFIDAARIDAVIDAIRARRIHDPVGRSHE